MSNVVSGEEPPARTDRLAEAVHDHLFARDGENIYAILDGASIPDLLAALAEHEPAHFCLYAGELDPELEAAAPYLVSLAPNSPFTRWLLRTGWGQHWGIFASSPAELREVRKHFRTFLIVNDVDGNALYFRYYDPRVMRLYLPTCTEDERGILFGPLSAYFFEGRHATQMIEFAVTDASARSVDLVDAHDRQNRLETARDPMPRGWEPDGDRPTTG